MKKKINLTNYAPYKAWELIYPMYCKDFLFRNDYTIFAEIVQEQCELTSEQWEYLLIQWEQKEMILTTKTN